MITLPPTTHPAMAAIEVSSPFSSSDEGGGWILCFPREEEGGKNKRLLFALHDSCGGHLKLVGTIFLSPD